MYIFLGLFLLSFGGISALFLRHISAVRALPEEELVQFVDMNPSPFYSLQQDYVVPFSRWCQHTASFLFYHFGEWVVRHIRALLLFVEKRLKRIGDYLHGRKIVMRKKGQSPFWDSMHVWKEEIKNDNSVSRKEPLE